MSKTGGQAEVRLHLAVRYNAMLVARQTKSSISHSIFSDHARTPSSQLILGASTHTTWLLTWGSRHSLRFNRCGLMLIRTSLRYLARAYVSQSGLSHTGRLEIEGLGLEDKVGLQLMLRLRYFFGHQLDLSDVSCHWPGGSAGASFRFYPSMHQGAYHDANHRSNSSSPTCAHLQDNERKTHRTMHRTTEYESRAMT
ncbi:hypothetical protein BS50DRAFT_331186 [Corynespora cassiicola Philippines]|uniref:Uncharacterized protein n=1 Tax=Corynespora cassiicola Philippines TaxID=1448308 RepID=A0A2T2NUD7_CORCC|nr:hypothetical protein BS50DRAFT_331186 [Corynespora cassiicola Philippines]